MDKISPERRAIYELVEFWETRCEPYNLHIHIANLWKLGGGRITWFLREVYDDLRAEKHSKYAASSAAEFKQFLVAEYRRLNQIAIEERQKSERKARADFDALGEEMAKATTRADLLELGQKRANLAPHTGLSYPYTSHCWGCRNHISSYIHAQCLDCKYYICSACGSCFCNYPRNTLNVHKISF